jgi:ribonuclease VapC
MSQKSKALVLDTWAVIAYLEDEPAGKQIADLITNAHDGDIPIYMSVVNVGEVWYIIAREVSEKEANSSVKQLSDLRISIVDADWNITQAAARFKSQQRMSYADCYAAALAKVKMADLVTGDKEFRAIEKQINLVWVGED